MSTSGDGGSFGPPTSRCKSGFAVPSELTSSFADYLSSLTRGPCSSGLSAGADPYLLGLLCNNNVYPGCLGVDAYNPQQFLQPCAPGPAAEHSRGVEEAALQCAGVAALGAVQRPGALGNPHAPAASASALPLAHLVKARLGAVVFAAVRAKVTAQQELFVQQMYEMHRVATRQRHLQAVCERPQALRAEIALQVTEARQRETMAALQARARDPAAVFGAEVLACTLAPPPPAKGGVGVGPVRGSCGADAGRTRRTEATSRPACGQAAEPPAAFLPSLKQRSKRARRSASGGTGCDEVGQSTGPPSSAPSPYAVKPYDSVAACGAPDALVSFAGSGGSAFRKVPQRGRGVRPAAASADSIGSENSKSLCAVCAGASGDADSGLYPPAKKAALTSAASILVSFSGA
ncbi:hypothetical protein WJX81_002210 [Elliptochloris bilobata]|uniref:Uncharacterized protein n=1 Tax=Elliptochloris bilobata TaxID=381761 RepID=A0AAW1RR71_9CHLO